MSNRINRFADTRFDQIGMRLDPLRRELIAHPIYSDMRELSSLQSFMEHHVFAVWDFMSLLKALQQRLCCTSMPWLPPVNLAAARLINEIVLAEETDEDGHGGFASHFELYRRAMHDCGANTQTIDRFLESMRAGHSLDEAMSTCDVPCPAKEFVRHTFEIIESGDLCAIASAFTFGREDLLPEVFQRIVDEMNAQSHGKLDRFTFYLNRHIELDGDSHGPMAMQLISSLCTDDAAKWQIVEDTAVSSLVARKALWDGMYIALNVE